MLEFGIQPVYVFDGIAPKLKDREKEKRRDRKMKAHDDMVKAQIAGDFLLAEKFSKRTLTVTKEHNDQGKVLLRLLGVPVIEAPTEAEAQCASLCKNGVVWATSTEDMDALTHGCPVLLRNLTYNDFYRKKPIQEIYLPAVLKGLQLQMQQFVDLCILLGCDYCESIYGIGPTKALELIQKFGSIERILENLDTSKYYIPDPFPFEEVRELFMKPKVLSDKRLEYEFIWEPPDEGGIKDFLISEHGFNEYGVNTILDRIRWFPGKVDNYTLALNRRNNSFNYRRRGSSNSNSNTNSDIFGFGRL